MKKIILFILLFGIAGCGFVFQNIDQGQDQGLAYGMSKEEVAAKIGQPQKISKMAIGDNEYDVWEYPDNNAQIAKMNGLGIISSKVFFLDGKLVQYGKDKVYGQPAYEYLESIDSDGNTVNPVKITEKKDT